MDHLEVFKALSNKTRYQILEWLKEPSFHFDDYNGFEHGVCVGQIQQKAQLTQSTISEYLSFLQRTGLIESTRVGQWTYYKRNEEAIARLKDVINKEL